MCGIAGFASRHFDPARLKKAIGRLRRRGPDAEDFWISDAYGLGHARLSIIDLSDAGIQPFHNEDRTVHLVANGEIYNYGPLMRELEQKGHQFKSRSDCEVLLHGYEEWGIDQLLQRCGGMFALAIVDETRQTMTIARDRLGKKPLYYWHDQQQLAFASELPALREMIPGPLEIDAAARDAYFYFGYIPGELTIYRHARKLLPAHYIVFSGAEIQRTRFWQCPLPLQDRTAATTVDDLHTAIERAVEERLVADRDLGVFLSGGIDSSLVASVAARKLSQVRTFSMGFQDDELDESVAAAAIADALGTRHTLLSCTEQDAVDTVTTLPETYGEPFADSSAIPTILLSKLTRNHVVVALSGDGGDELCLGYDRYRRAAMVERLLHVPGRRITGTVGQALFPQSSYPWKFSRAMTVADEAEACLLFSGIFHSLYFKRLFGREPSLRNSYWNCLFEQARSAGLVRAWSWVDIHHYLVEDILTKVDRASMSFGLEVRAPLLDHRVVECCASLPLRLKLQGRESKIALRRILAGLLPAALWERPKSGFVPPLGKWLNGPLKELMYDHLDSNGLADEPEMNAAFVRTLMDEHALGRRDNSRFLWTLLMWRMWRQYAQM